MSILSFHATKVFNTFEGGAIICPDAKTKQRFDYLKNFGFADEVTVVAPGINGKMNEVQAAFGLLQLRHVDQAIEARGRIDARYRQVLADVPGIRVVPPPARASRNYSYFPVLVEPEYGMSRDDLYEVLRKNDILSRRYFYPLISEMPMYRGIPSAASPRRLMPSWRSMCLSWSRPNAAQTSFILPLMPGATTVVSLTKPKFFRWSMRCLVRASGQMIAPPSKVLNTLVAWKLRMDMSPCSSTDTPSSRTPNAWAAS